MYVQCTKTKHTSHTHPPRQGHLKAKHQRQRQHQDACVDNTIDDAKYKVHRILTSTHAIYCLVPGVLQRSAQAKILDQEQNEE